MSGMDDLLKSMAMFKSGLNQYAQKQAYNDANAQLAQLNTNQDLKPEDRLNMQSQIGNSLAMRLGAAGADPNAIQVAREMGPSAGAQYQAMVGQKQQLQSEQFQAGQNESNRALESRGLDIKSRMVDAMAGKVGIKNFQDAMNSFGKSDDGLKTILKNIPDMQASIKSFDQNDNTKGINAIVQMAKIGAIKSQAGGRVNTQELQNVDPNSSAAQKALRNIALQMTGQEPADIVGFWKGFLQNKLHESQDYLYKSIDGQSKAASSIYGGTVDPSALKTALMSKHSAALQGYQPPGAGATGSWGSGPQQQGGLMKYYSPGK